MKTHTRYIPFGLAAAGAVLYISLIFNNNLWMDEAFSAVLAGKPFSYMMEHSISDSLPPLYNIILWTMAHIFGYSSVVLKFTSVIPMILLLLLGCTRVCRDFGVRVSGIFLLCLISVPEMFHYGLEIRMYSWSLLFVTAAGIFAFECIASDSIFPWIMLILFTLLSAWTHHFALIESAFVWMYLLIITAARFRNRLKRFVLSAVLLILLYIPCLWFSIIQLRYTTSYFTAAAPSAGSFFSALRFPFVTNITPLSAILLTVFIVAACIGSRQPAAYMYMSIYVLALIFAYAVMLFTGSTFFSARYLFPSFGLLWLGFAISAGRPWHFARPEKPALIIMCIILILSGIADFRSQFISEYCTGVDAMTSFFSENLNSDDAYIIYENNYQIENCMKYYEPALKRCDWDTASDVKGTIWYFEVPGYEKELDAAGIYGYNKEYIGDMSFSIYSFKLYKLTKATDN